MTVRFCLGAQKSKGLQFTGSKLDLDTTCMASSTVAMLKDFDLRKDFNFWKNIVLFVVFFTITPFTIFVSLFSLVSLSKANATTPRNNVNFSAPLTHTSGAKVFASLPSNVPLISQSIEVGDSRPEIVKKYLVAYNSPLAKYAPLIVQTADKYSLDFRLITAIAQQESNLCKIIPEGSYNCWGWGITSQATLHFNSFDEGIETVSKGLKSNYIDQGYKTPEEIMSKYTPSSPGSWAKGVTEFMSEME